MTTDQSSSENDTSPKRNTQRARLAIFDLFCALIIGLFAAYTNPNSPVETGSRAQDSYYNLQVQGFRAGQLNVKKEVPAELGKIAHPYDPHDFRDSSQYVKDVTDLSYYKGKLYLYYGVTPVLVLLWPYTLLTGHYLSDKYAVLVFFTLGFWLAATLLRNVRRRYFPEASNGLLMAALFMSGLAIALTLWCNTNEVALTCGFAFTMLALTGIWQAMHDSKRGALWLMLASVAYGLAVGARPSLLFGIVILLIPAFRAWYQAPGSGSYRQAGLLSLAAVIPAMLIGAGLLLYNDLRFDNPFEFGWHYQLNELYRPPTAKQFSLDYFWFNFRDYFLEPVLWNGHFPFLQTVPLPPVPAGYTPEVQTALGAIPSTYPLVFLVLAVPLAWRTRPTEAALISRLYAAALFLLFIICFSTMCLFFSAATRYELDFLPALLLLAFLGVLGLDCALASSTALRRIVRWGVCFLAAYSLVFNALISVETHAEIDYLAGNASASVGKLDEAMAQYQKALALWPGGADAHFGAGNIFYRKGQMDAAIAEYKKAVELNPNFPEAHNNLADSFLKTGRLDEAIVQYQKTLEITPDFVVARNNLAYCFLEVGQLDNAIAQYQKAIELQPDFAPYHCALGNALRQKGQIDEAMIEYQKALKIKPDFAAAHNYLAFCLYRTGQMDQAVVEYRKATELAPQSAVFRSDLGNALLQKGNATEAIIQYQKALELQPQSADVCKRLGDAFFQTGQLDEAIIQFQNALEMDPGFVEAHNNLGFCLLQKGRVDDAIAQYQKAIALQPDFAQAYNNLGDAFHRKGMETDATAAYKKAIELQARK